MDEKKAKGNTTPVLLFALRIDEEREENLVNEMSKWHI